MDTPRATARPQGDATASPASVTPQSGSSPLNESRVVQNGAANAAPTTTPDATAPEAIEESTPPITIDQFFQTDLRVAQILEAEKLKKSEKLVKLLVDLGKELGRRQIVAGVGRHFTPESLIGRKIVIVANLQPAKLMGELSEGMLLAASDELGNLELVQPGTTMPPGARVR